MQPIRYAPTLKQAEFHAGRGVWTYRACLCGTGAGKTLCGLAEDYIWACAYPGSVGYIFEPNYPMIRRILYPTLAASLLFGEPFECFPSVAEYSRFDNRVTFENGSQWWFVSLDDPEKAEGPNIDYAHVDEARLCRNFDVAWRVIQRRLRGSGRCRVPVKPSAWLTTTPSPIGTFLWDICENPKTKPRSMRVYRWSTLDNPKLPAEFKQQVIESHRGGLAERFIYGRFAVASEGTLGFDGTVNIGEVSNLQVIRSFAYGVDFGWTNPTAIVVVGFDGDGRAWVLDEVYQTRMPSEQIMQELTDLTRTYGRGPIYCDPSEPQTIFKLVQNGLDARGYGFKREDGLRELASRLAKAGDGRPRLMISSRCVNLIGEIMEFDENVKENDHAVDALRYSLPVNQVTREGAGAFFVPHEARKGSRPAPRIFG